MLDRLRLLLVLGALASPSALLAQNRPGTWTFGGEIGLTAAQPISFMESKWLAFSHPEDAPPARCWKSAAPHLGFLAGREFIPHVQIEANFSLVAGPGGACSYTEHTGDRIEVRYTGRSPGPSYLAGQIRAVVEPGAGVVRPRVLAGLGWIPKKRVPSVVFGAGISSGKASTRFVSDFGLQITRVRWQRQFQCFGDCGAYPSVEWFDRGTTTSFQPYGRLGIEF